MKTLLITIFLASSSIFGLTKIKPGTFICKGWNYGYNELTLKVDFLFSYTKSTDYGLSITYNGSWDQKNDTISLVIDSRKTTINSGDTLGVQLIKDSKLKLVYRKDCLYELTQGDKIKDVKFRLERKK